MPRRLSAAASPPTPACPVRRRRCWTVCEGRESSTTTTSETGNDVATPEPTETLCRANSLRLSIKEASPVDQRESSHYLLSPCHSPSFSFDSVGDFFAAMNSPLQALTSPSPTGRRTVLLNEDSTELRLLRDDAEYSDYLTASVTGAHSEMDSVVFYELEVHLSQLHWKLYRRFSEFRALRQDLIKHFGRRLRAQQHQSASSSHASGGSTKCEICTNMLDTIEQSPFPSRQQTHRHWHRLFSSNTTESTARTTTSGQAVSSAAAVVADRKVKFAAFVAVCLCTMRGLRQHGNVMEDSSACEIGTALRLIEEFFGLSFTRYVQFLSERGVVGDEQTKSTVSQRRLTTTAV